MNFCKLMEKLFIFRASWISVFQIKDCAPIVSMARDGEGKAAHRLSGSGRYCLPYTCSSGRMLRSSLWVILFGYCFIEIHIPNNSPTEGVPSYNFQHSHSFITVTTVSFRTPHHLRSPINILFIPLLAHPPVLHSHRSTFYSYRVLILDMSCKWNYAICGLL